MSEWKEYRLGDVAEVLGGFAFKSTEFGEVGYPVVKIKDIVPPIVAVESCERVNVSAYDTQRIEKYKLKRGDYLVAMTGATVGKVGRIGKDFDGYLNQRVARIKAYPRIADNNFIYYCVARNVFQEFVINAASGSSVQENASATDIGEFEILLPSLPEQRAIASVLSSLDDKIDLLHRQNKTLEALAETVFRQWFVEEAEEKWDSVSISEVAEINGRTITNDYSHSEIEYLDTGSITNGVITAFQTFPLADAPSRAQRIVKDNDIVYSLVRPVQRHYGLLHGVKLNTVASTGFCVITSREISPHFLYLLLTRDETVEYFDMIAEASTSTYPSLKPSDIADFEFLKPPENKLKNFSNQATDTWRKIHTNQSQIRTLTRLRDTLLPKLMSGEVKVKSEK